MFPKETQHRHKETTCRIRHLVGRIAHMHPSGNGNPVRMDALSANADASALIILARDADEHA